MEFVLERDPYILKPFKESESILWFKGRNKPMILVAYSIAENDYWLWIW